jgi:ABC-type multidrug transport system fused ATPase/permease subunit
VQPGEILAEAWRLYAAHWRHLLALSVLVYLAVSLLVLAFAFLIGILSAFISLAGVFWLQAVLVKAVEDIRDGRADMSVRATLESALPRINAVSAVGLLASIAIGIGLALFIVPGLILLTIWSVVVPVLMLEGTGVLRSFGRSQELVRGHGWSVFAVVAISIVLILLAGIVLGLVFQPINPEWLESVVVNVTSNAIFAPFAALAWTLMYFRLRELQAAR